MPGRLQDVPTYGGCFQLWPPYPDVGIFYQNAIHGLYSQLSSFQDFILYTEVRLQKDQVTIVTFQFKLLEGGTDEKGTQTTMSQARQAVDCICQSTLSKITKVQELILRQ